MRNSRDIDNFGYGDGTYNTGIGDGYGCGSSHITGRPMGDGFPSGGLEDGDGYSPEWEDDEDYSA